jgi:hypothetical protein
MEAEEEQPKPHYPLKAYSCIGGCVPCLFAFCGPNELGSESGAVGCCCVYAALDYVWMGWAPAPPPRPLHHRLTGLVYRRDPPPYCDCGAVKVFHLNREVAGMDDQVQRSLVADYRCLCGLHPIGHCFSGPNEYDQFGVGYALGMDTHRFPEWLWCLCCICCVCGLDHISDASLYYQRDGELDYVVAREIAPKQKAVTPSNQ